MFISKKKFEEALENAKMQGAKETEEKIWHQERLHRLEEDFDRRMRDIEKRLWMIEHPNGEKCEKTIMPMG